MKSLTKTPRTADVILYYPLPEYKRVLRDLPFRIINKIVVPELDDAVKKFLIYRYPVRRAG